MSSAKLYFFDLCIVLVFEYVILAEQISSTVSTDVANRGNCSCGAFNKSTIEASSVPIISRMPGLEVNCDAVGEATCKSLCNALAIATKAKGPEILCVKLKDAHDLKLSAFSQVCDRAWVYADMTADEPLCCQDNKPIICQSSENINVN